MLSEDKYQVREGLYDLAVSYDKTNPNKKILLSSILEAGCKSLCMGPVTDEVIKQILDCVLQELGNETQST